jgi:hypothetical protein
MIFYFFDFFNLNLLYLNSSFFYLIIGEDFIYEFMNFIPVALLILMKTINYLFKIEKILRFIIFI